MQWAETVLPEEFSGPAEIEDRVLAGGVPGGPAPEPRRVRPVQVVLVLLAFVVPVLGWAAFVETAVFFQDGVLRVIGLDLDPDTRLWLGAVCFTIASIEVLGLLSSWWRQGRERAGFLAGLAIGIAVLAALTVVPLALDPAAHLPDGFDARLVPVGIALVLGAAAGCSILLGYRRGARRPAALSGPPISRSELAGLSPHEMNALLDQRRYLLQVLVQRGLIDVDVDELDRKPLGSFE